MDLIREINRLAESIWLSKDLNYGFSNGDKEILISKIRRLNQDTFIEFAGAVMEWTDIEIDLDNKKQGIITLQDEILAND